MFTEVQNNGHMAKQKETIGMRPENDVRELMRQAQEATGNSASDLLNLCVRKSINEVVVEIARTRDQALRSMGLKKKP